MKHNEVMLCSCERSILHGCVGVNDVRLMNKRSKTSIEENKNKRMR